MYELLKVDSVRSATDEIVQKRSLYNRSSGYLAIPDCVDGAEHERKYGPDDTGVEAVDGDWIYGLMTCRVDFDEAVRKEQFYDSITELALEEFAAAGTGVEERFGYVSFESKDDLWNFLTELFDDEPEDWFSEA